jgi:hypothetical protein
MLPTYSGGGLVVNPAMPTGLFARDVTANPKDETNGEGRPPSAAPYYSFRSLLQADPLSHKVEFVESDRFTVIGEQNLVSLFRNDRRQAVKLFPGQQKAVH